MTYIYDDKEGVSYHLKLTPSSLIYGRRIATTPNESQYEIVSANKSLTGRVKYQATVFKNFTDQWRKEYLLSVRESSRVQDCESNDINVGNVVDHSQERKYMSYLLEVGKSRKSSSK